MMTHQRTAVAQYQGSVPEGLLPHIKNHILAFDLPIEETDHSLTVSVPGSDTTFYVQPNRIRVTVFAVSDATLFQARESVGFLFDHVFPDAGKSMIWKGDIPNDTRPPNFQTAVVQKTQRIGANFIRVDVRCADISKLLVGGMHFTLAIPPDPSTPVWPYLNHNGRTVWPDGKDTLHRAAYTFVTLDKDTGGMSFDVFLHEGGGVSEWALSATSGQTVGLVGPGGGDFPQARHLLMGGDETALPAIRRILENAPKNQSALVWIELGDDRDRQEIACPEQVEIRWIRRGVDRSLLECLKTSDWSQDSFIWLAAEQHTVRDAKTYFKSQGLPRTQSYFAIYWTR